MIGLYESAISVEKTTGTAGEYFEGVLLRPCFIATFAVLPVCYSWSAATDEREQPASDTRSICWLVVFKRVYLAVNNDGVRGTTTT